MYLSSEILFAPLVVYLFQLSYGLILFKLKFSVYLCRTLWRSEFRQNVIIPH